MVLQPPDLEADLLYTVWLEHHTLEFRPVVHLRLVCYRILVTFRFLILTGIQALKFVSLYFRVLGLQLILMVGHHHHLSLYGSKSNLLDQNKGY